MSKNIKLASILAKNQLAATAPWLQLLQVVLDPEDNPGEVLYLVNNNEDITFKGQVYTAFNFKLEVVSTKSGGELSQVQLVVSNINRAMQAEIEEFAGATDSRVTLILVEAGHLDDDPELQVSFTVLQTSSDEEWVSFTLGAANPLRQNFPLQYYFANYCRHRFNTPEMQANLDPRGAACNYQGNLTSCSKLLNGDNGCRAHNNIINFGGQPGIDVTGFRRAVV